MNINIRTDARGTLGVIEFSELPFTPARTFWISDVPRGETRGHHAHKRCEQFIVSLTGHVSFRVLTRSGSSTTGVIRPGNSLHLRTLEWIVLDDFSENAVILVYCSTPFDESDYIRDLDEFSKS